MSDIDAATPATGPGAAEGGGNVRDSSARHPSGGESAAIGEETLPVKEDPPPGGTADNAPPSAGTGGVPEAGAAAESEAGDPTGEGEEATGGTGDEDEAAADDGTESGESADAGSEDTGSPDAGERGSRRGARSRSGAESLQRLEEEGEVAADYLEELLDIADLDGDIDIDVENGRASVAIVAEGSAERDLRRLVGPKGETLEALQELSRLAVQARTGDRSRLMLDVAGFRAARRRTLEDVAARACQEVQRTGAKVQLEPMTAFERKVVHDVVAEAGLVSESEGEEPQRRVVVHPAG